MLAEFSTVTLLYTANIKGNLHLLPRLFTLIQQQHRAAKGPVFLFDVGDTCARESWVCQATHGRAPFLVLDSMGYDGAIIGGGEEVPIPPSALRQLAGDMLMKAIIWDRAKPVTRHGITLTVAPGRAEVPDDAGPVIRVDRTSSALPTPGDSPPVLRDVTQGAIVAITMTWPAWTVAAAQVFTISERTPVDPTIAAVVELVESEARHTLHGQGEA